VKKSWIVLVAIFFGVWSGMLSAGASAYSYAESVSVVRVHARFDGWVFISVSNPPPDTCRWFGETFIFSISTDAGKAMYSNLLAGKAGAKKISIWYSSTTATYGSTDVNGCSDGSLAVVKGIAQT